MEVTEITLKQYRKEFAQTYFANSYKKLQLDIELDETEIHHLLKNAIIFTNFGDINIQKLGYKIIVTYSNKYNDYKPLYDFAINKGYIPISKLVELKYSEEDLNDHFFNLFFSVFQENFRENNYYISNGQKKLIEFSTRMTKVKRCAKKGVEAMRELARDQRKATRETIREYQEYLYV